MSADRREELLSILHRYRRGEFGLAENAANAIEFLYRDMALGLRKLAVAQHVRMTEGGGTVPNGFSCRLCKAEWPDGLRERHEPGCAVGTESAKEKA